jgi:hypothetical protein
MDRALPLNDFDPDTLELLSRASIFAEIVALRQKKTVGRVWL